MGIYSFAAIDTDVRIPHSGRALADRRHVPLHENSAGHVCPNLEKHLDNLHGANTTLWFYFKT